MYFKHLIELMKTKCSSVLVFAVVDADYQKLDS